MHNSTVTLAQVHSISLLTMLLMCMLQTTPCYKLAIDAHCIRKGKCQAAKECEAEKEWMSAEVTATEDRECTTLTACKKVGTEYESAAPTAVADRVCKAVTACKDTEIEQKKPTATADRVCANIPKSCKDFVGVHTKNGIYSIMPDGKNQIDAYCNMNLAKGGWTLILVNSDDGSPNGFHGSALPNALNTNANGKYFGDAKTRNKDYKGKSSLAAAVTFF